MLAGGGSRRLRRAGLGCAPGSYRPSSGRGIATLYRRFPTREDLIAASFERTMTAYADAVDEALSAESAWTGFCGYVERVCAMQAADCGLRDVLTLTFPRAGAFEAQRLRAYEGFSELVRRARPRGPCGRILYLKI